MEKWLYYCYIKSKIETEAYVLAIVEIVLSMLSKSISETLKYTIYVIVFKYNCYIKFF